jgi:glutaminyl-tRNA synthetase
MAEDILTKLQLVQVVDNPKLLASLQQVADVAGLAESGCSKEVGALIYKLVTAPKGKALPDGHRDMLARRIGSGDIARNLQLDAALKYLGGAAAPTDAELCAQSGVGITVDDAEIARAVEALIAAERDAIADTRYLTNVGTLLKALTTGAAAERLQWVDGVRLKAALDAAVAALLGPKTAVDLDPKAAKAAAEAAKAARGGGAPAAKAAAGKGAAETKPASAAHAAAAPAPTESVGAERRFLPPCENFGEPPYALNSAELLAAHLATTGGKVVTRFPPEPNGVRARARRRAVRPSPRPQTPPGARRRVRAVG